MGLCGSKTSDSPVAVQGDEKKGSVDQWMRVLPAPDADLSAIAAALVSKANTDTTLSPPGACCGCLKASGNGCFELRMAAAGVRQRDTKGNAVRHTDVWHLGSCTKAMTATLVAVLIDAGSFPGYSTTLAQCTQRVVSMANRALRSTGATQTSLWSNSSPTRLAFLPTVTSGVSPGS
jgi:hypothetical protein